VWLHFDGIAQQGDVWLDGDYVGDTEGYFVPHRFEITDQAAARRDHVLAVDVSCRPFDDEGGRTDLTGAYQDPELSGAAGLNPGGIWRGVHVATSGTSAIAHFRARCLDADPRRARIGLRCVFDTPEAGEVVLRTQVAGIDHDFTHSAAAGENRVEWTVDVAEPELWWPHTLGDQPIHDLRCALVVDGREHDERRRRIGLRSVRMRQWTLHVNGERLYTKGVGLLPTRPRPADASSAEIVGDVRAARDAGADLIRLVAHIARPELYQAADDLGLLIWQDLPVRGVMARSTRTQAVRQAREAVDLLAHHPSVAVWCAHDEPHPTPDPPTATPPLLSQQRPSWNRSVLDRSLKRVLERTDGSRPVVSHTNVSPAFPELDGTTSHLWFGWAAGRAADLAPALARTPRMGRFVSALGAASVDPRLAMLQYRHWPAVDWDAIGAACGVDPRSLHHLVPPDARMDGERWAELTRVAQAEVVRTTVELLRRVKYRPNAGFVQFALADATAAGGYGLLDHERRPKPAWQAMVDACREVIVVADPLPPVVRPGERIDVDVHVVSDRRRELTAAEVRATVVGPVGPLATQRWTGGIPADDCAFIGRVGARVPFLDGELVLDLELTAGDVAVTNRYRAVIG